MNEMSVATDGVRAYGPGDGYDQKRKARDRENRKYEREQRKSAAGWRRFMRGFKAPKQRLTPPGGGGVKKGCGCSSYGCLVVLGLLLVVIATQQLSNNKQPAAEKSDPTEVTDADSARLEAAALATAEQQSLPTYVPARKRFPGDPYYIRAVIQPGKHTEAELIKFAKRIIAAADTPTGVVDFFDSDGPLAWSGLMAMNSDKVKQKWLCRVTLKDDNPPVFELGKDKNGKTREDALSGN